MSDGMLIFTLGLCHYRAATTVGEPEDIFDMMITKKKLSLPCAVRSHLDLLWSNVLAQIQQAQAMPDDFI